MTYTCNDCSYRGKKSGQDGSCPACGSFNLGGKSGQTQETPKPGKLRLALLVGLWVYLIGLIIWKLEH
ncbi:MAG: hypothetical protein V2I26_17690 [Halieaceae bacterium]|jgi:hypothetical protein|nr:hypothetical protein [Halieaceae bacterium]